MVHKIITPREDITCREGEEENTIIKELEKARRIIRTGKYIFFMIGIYANLGFLPRIAYFCNLFLEI